MSRLQNALGIRVPLIVAPMAGGPSSVDLVVASSEAGALGSIPAAYLSAEKCSEAVQAVRARTQAPLAINLFISKPIEAVSQQLLGRAIAATEVYRNEFQLPKPELQPPYEENFDLQFDAVLRLKPRVFSFVFGLLGQEYVTELKKAGIYAIGAATSLAEAEALEASGIDAIVAQGFESGGHRAIFDSSSADPEVALFDLLRQMKGKIALPLIAAGGIMTSADIQQALSLGADAVQMGTAFLATAEAGTSLPYRQKLLESSERVTRTTRAFSGRLARGIPNRFMRERDADPQSILPYPAQNRFTRDLRTASANAGSADFLSLWAGAGAGALHTGSARNLIQSLFEGVR